jgi:hypothetical protein
MIQEDAVLQRVFGIAAGVFLALLLTVASLSAHHSLASEFDANKPVKISGTVRKVEWKNPHVWFYVDGKDEVSGRTAVWGILVSAPNQLRRNGVPRDVLKQGDKVKIEGFLAKDGSANAVGKQEGCPSCKVTFADGRTVFPE